MSLVWCEINDGALAANISTFRRIHGPHVILAVAVKANGYGHGIVKSAEAFLSAGADWLCVHSLDEALTLRREGVEAPVYIIGPVSLGELEQIPAADARMVVYDLATVERLGALGHPVRLHLKIETGNHRQGVSIGLGLKIAQRIAAYPHLELEGVSSHFANIEDTTDHRYARRQLSLFDDAVAALEGAGFTGLIRNLSNSAAGLLWPNQSFEMIRVGIGAYGHWPSKETRLAAALTGRADLELHPALEWKTEVAQIKAVPQGSFVGYGCTFMTTHDSKIAVLPVGYYDGYDRGLSNLAYVLIHGHRAPVRGRICMNLIMVDVTDIPGVKVGDEVVLLGRSGAERITAEQVADWAGSINYEILSRIGGHVQRRRVVRPADQLESDALYRAPKGL